MDILSAVPFDPSMVDAIAGFDCGSEPWQQELAAWLTTDCTAAMSRGTRVWLYVNAAGEVVGYGSVGMTNWKYPDPESRRIPAAIIPAVALHRRFHGQPADAPREDRYSSQILRHLIHEAELLPGPPPALGLFVHADNAAAVKLYERFGFQPFHHQYRDPQTGAVYLGYIRRLVAEGL